MLTNDIGQDGYQVAQQQGMRLLRNPARPWASVSGRLWTFWDEDVLDLGRARFHSDHADRDAASVGDNGEGEVASLRRIQGHYRFWATQPPWRLRLETRREVLPKETEYEPMPEVLIFDRETWWALSTGLVESNNGDERSTYSPQDLDLLLAPAALAKALEFTQVTQLEVDGRAAFQLEAMPAASFDAFASHARGLALLGAGLYVLTVDGTYGIVLHVDAYVERRLARRLVLTDVRIDEPVDPLLFTPPGRAGVS